MSISLDLIVEKFSWPLQIREAKTSKYSIKVQGRQCSGYNYVPRDIIMCLRI